ncbi:MAG: bifunctional UDP-3-O-[3-hydroxymyristoyl] N-acetylglucosamine deacetylase/3-hydroxyacyl-ACP dehydratase, partial [Bacteroidia bacterium]
LAALVGMDLDNVLMELDGPELPIMDGSSKPFMDALKKAGIEEQDKARVYFELEDKLEFRDDQRNVEIFAIPAADYRVTVMIDYNSPVLGSQHFTLEKLADFGKEIASSRTFCFLHELEYLHKNNLIKGGDMSNAIVVVDKPVSQEELNSLASLFNKPTVEVAKEGILNNVELHYHNEPARHKLLDVIGDLALLGVRLKAHVFATRPGHAANVEFAKKLKKLLKKSRSGKNAPKYNPNTPPLFDIEAIQKILPHRQPFLLVDKIIEMSETHVVGVKNVTMNEEFFNGHFPGSPVMPGVLQIEAMAQTGGILVLNTVPDPENYLTYFMKIDQVRFRSKVVPGDTLIFKLELLSPIRRGIAQMRGYAFVGDTIVMEAELMAQIVKKAEA